MICVLLAYVFVRMCSVHLIFTCIHNAGFGNGLWMWTELGNTVVGTGETGHVNDY